MVRGMILFLLLVLDDFDGELIVMCSFTEERCVVNQVRIVVVGGILIEPSSTLSAPLARLTEKSGRELIDTMHGQEG